MSRRITVWTRPLRLGASLTFLRAKRPRGARFLRLQSRCELLADGFEDLNELIADYVREVPRGAAAVATHDAERFLDWIESRLDLTDVQRDFVACQRGRDAVEFIALRKRLAHVRFQELLVESTRRIDEITPQSRLTLHFNPIHAWSALETHVLLDDADSVPATVLFFAVGRDTRSLVMTSRTEPVVRMLERQGPVAIRRLVRGRSRKDRTDVARLLQDLVELGIVAVG